MAETATAPTAPVASGPSAGTQAPNSPKPGQPTPATQPTGASPAAPQKPLDPIEGELAGKFGEKWTALSDDMRAQIVAAERKSRDADRRYQMVAKLQKDHDLTQRQAGMLLDSIVNDPGAIFSNPEIMKRLNRGKLREFAERIVWEQIQEERMDPKDRRIAELERFQNETLAEKKTREEADKKAAFDKKLAEDTAKKRAYWETEIIGALKAQGIEADAEFIGQIARYIKAARVARQSVDLPRIIQHVQSDFLSRQNRYLVAGFKPRQEGETNEAFAQRYQAWVSKLNPALVDLIRAGDLATLKNKNMGRPAAPKSEPKKDPGKKISSSEWLAQRAERMRQ